MTLYVKSRGARSNNIEIEGTGGRQRDLRKNVPGVIFFANTGVRSIMFSDKNSVFRVRVEMLSLGVLFVLTSTCRARENSNNVRLETRSISFLLQDRSQVSNALKSKAFLLSETLASGIRGAGRAGHAGPIRPGRAGLAGPSTRPAPARPCSGQPALRPS